MDVSNIDPRISAPVAGSNPNSKIISTIQDLSEKITDISQEINTICSKKQNLQRCPATLFAIIGLAMVVAGIALMFLTGGAALPWLLPLILGGGILVAVSVNMSGLMYQLKVLPYTSVQEPLDKLQKVAKNVQVLIDKVEKKEIEPLRAKYLFKEYCDKIADYKKDLEGEIQRLRDHEKITKEEKQQILNAMRQGKRLMDLVDDFETGLHTFGRHKLGASGTILAPRRGSESSSAHGMDGASDTESD